MEPLTLTEDQLQEAREEAVDIIRKTHKDEALTIFTAGLLPVHSVREMECLKQNEAQKLINLRDKSKITSFLSLDVRENNDQFSPSPQQPGSVRSAPF